MWTIATPFINKPDIIPLWLENFKQLDFPRHEFKLVWIDMTENPELSALLKVYIKEHGHEFKEVEYIENPFAAEETVPDFIMEPEHPLFATKRQAVVRTMNLINSRRVGNLFLWEDDIIAPPDAWHKLKHIFDKSELFLGVTGTQYYRHPEREGAVLAWNWDVLYVDSNMNYAIRNIAEKEKGVEAIGASASGFTLYREEFLNRHTFSVRNNLSQDMMAGFHINNFDQFPFGGPTKLMIVWGVKLTHLGIDSNGKVKEYKSRHFI